MFTNLKSKIRSSEKEIPDGFIVYSKKMFYLCKLKENRGQTPLNSIFTVMKDRIRQVMESQHMTQQVFAEFIQMSPASLSSIFNGRTRPTLNIVEAIKKKIPNINTDWLMFGSGDMYKHAQDSSESEQTQPASGQEQLLDFGNPTPPPQAIVPPTPQAGVSQLPHQANARSTHQETVREEIKYVDKPQRRVTEIRVYYDDQTWESFTPSKSK